MEILKTTFNTKVGKVTCYNNDHYFYNSFLTGNPYEQKMIDDYLKSFVLNSENILDIGSHIGYHSLSYSKINPNVKILAFEPQRRVFELLQENIESNALKNVTAFNLAVSNKVGIFSLSNSIPDGKNANTNIEYGTDKSFNLGGVSLGKNGEQVQTTTIDNLELKNLDFIKIDVEGAESLVILGGIETIKKYKPIICFESNFKTITQDMKEMFGCEDSRTPNEILQEIGYTIFAKITNDNIIAIYN
jgi:FkbM family methyltransferase